MPVGNIIQRAREDARRVINGGFSIELSITAPGESPIVIQGIGVRHSTTYDTDGLETLGKNARVTIHEKDLTDAGLTTRNANNDLIIDQGWIVNFTDDIGSLGYKIGSAFDDRTLGLIRIQLLDR